METLCAGVSRFMARIGGIALLSAALLVCVEVLWRASGSRGFSVGTEFSTYALASGSSWALAYVVFEKAHVRVDFVNTRLPVPLRAALDVVAMASLALIGCVLSYGAFDTAITSLEFGAKANTTMGTPLVVPQSIWALGIIWFALMSIYRTVAAARSFLAQEWQQVLHIAASPGAAEEYAEAISQARQRLNDLT